MKRIAISGKMTAGKTVSADYLVSELGYTRLFFAEGVKRLGKIITESYQHENYVGFLEEMTEAVYDIFDNNMEYIPKAREAMIQCRHQFESVGLTMRTKDENHRALLQQIGTEYMRSIKPTVWCDYLANQVKQTPNYAIVVDDMRFKDEFATLKDLGFVTVRINLSPEVQQQRLTNLYGKVDPAAILHKSETELDDADFDFYLDGTIPLGEMLLHLKGIAHLGRTF